MSFAYFKDLSKMMNGVFYFGISSLVSEIYTFKFSPKILDACCSNLAEVIYVKEGTK